MGGSPHIQTIGLETAVAEIKQGARPGPASPWFLMVGAGVSLPHVPAAWGIIKKCQEKVGTSTTPSSIEPGAEYAYWLKTAFAAPTERQRLFQSLIEGARISHVNFRIAHLLESGVLGRLLLTTNFDDLVSRALRLLGREHIVCDHPATVKRIDESRNDIQVVHIHGSYWFYDACNLKDEISIRAEEMAGFMTRIVRKRSPIVVGYSGQEENDAFMTTLKRELATDAVRVPAYWFCYSRSEPEQVARVLEGRVAHIKFVVPQYKTERLDGRHVFDALIQAFDLGAPQFLANPLEFLATSFERSLPPTELAGADAYQDTLLVVADRIRDAADHETKRRAANGQILDEIRAAAARQDWERAAKCAGTIAVESLDGPLRKEIALALTHVGFSAPKQLGLEVFEHALRVLTHRVPGADRHMMGILALASCARAQLLEEVQPRLAREAWERVATAFEGTTDPFLRECHVRARINRALLDLDDRRLELRDIVQELASEQDAKLRAERARVRLLLAASGTRDAVTLEVYDEIIGDLEGQNDSAEFHRYLSIALVLRALRLRDLGRSADALEDAKRILRLPNDGYAVDESAVRNVSDMVVHALSSKLTGLSELPAEERAARSTALITEFANIEHPPVRALLSGAHYYAAMAFAELGAVELARNHAAQALLGLDELPSDVQQQIRDDLTAMLERLPKRG